MVQNLLDQARLISKHSLNICEHSTPPTPSAPLVSIPPLSPVDFTPKIALKPSHFSPPSLPPALSNLHLDYSKNFIAGIPTWQGKLSNIQEFSVKLSVVWNKPWWEYSVEIRAFFCIAGFSAHCCLGLAFQSVPTVSVDPLQQLPVAFWIKAKPPQQCVTHLLHSSLPGTWPPGTLSSSHTGLSVPPTCLDLPLYRGSEQAAPPA